MPAALAAGCHRERRRDGILIFKFKCVRGLSQKFQIMLRSFLFVFNFQFGQFKHHFFSFVSECHFSRLLSSLNDLVGERDRICRFKLVCHTKRANDESVWILFVHNHKHYFPIFLLQKTQLDFFATHFFPIYVKENFHLSPKQSIR